MQWKLRGVKSAAGFRHLTDEDSDIHVVSTPKCRFVGFIVLLSFAIIIFTACVIYLLQCIPHLSPVLPAKSLSNPPKPSPGQCAALTDELKFDCLPRGHQQDECEERGCCWQPAADADSAVPWCFYPSPYGGYKTINVTDTPHGWTAFAERTFKSGYPDDIHLLRIDALFYSDDTVRVKIYDPLKQRYEVPMPVVPPPVSPEQTNVRSMVVPDRNGFRVVRPSTGVSLFDALTNGGFIFADQFLQLSALLPTSYVYGLGETRDELTRSTNWKQVTLFNHDHVPQEEKNLYGTHPFYMAMEEDGNSHGVLLLNSNAMDVILQPAPAVTFRTIGGVFDFFFFFGPTPGDVVSQYTKIVGMPHMPPYWGLGFHLCRFNYSTLEKTKKVWKRTRDAGIPFDVQWNDLDYMDDSKDFTYDKKRYQGLPDFVKELHDVGMHYIPLIDPGISAAEPAGSYPPYDDGYKLRIFVRNESGLPFVGKVWNPIATVWPDFTNPDVVEYWLHHMLQFHSQVPFDGAWIDMNEPSNFYAGTAKGCLQTKWDYPPYIPGVDGNKLFYRTLCMSARHRNGIHYDLHNLYGLSEAIVTNFVLKEIRGERPFIISRSTFVGQGQFSGHWTGDNAASWYDMRKSIAGVLSFNIFAIPLVGADICGFRGNTTPKLCARWMQLGAFYPFSRNHNDEHSIDQDPVALGPEVVTSARKALLVRYSLLPYLYTLFWRAHVLGETVARPLFFEFPKDMATYVISDQFLWGSALMIVPVLEENVTSVMAYIPQGLWYDYYTMKPIVSEGDTFRLTAPADTIPLLLRSGSIIPKQQPGVTTTLSRKNAFELLVALSHDGTAVGQLYWDDGDGLNTWELNKYNLLNFTIHGKILWSTVLHLGYEDAMILDSITILGVSAPVQSVLMNRENIPFSYNASNKVLNIYKLGLPLQSQFTVIWR